MDYKKFTNRIGKGGEYIDFSPWYSSNGDFEKQTGINVLIMSLRNILQIPRGTYPFDPDRGSLLHEYVWEPFTEDTEVEIEEEIEARILELDPRIVLENLELIKLKNFKGFRVELQISLEGEVEKTSIDISDRYLGFMLEES